MSEELTSDISEEIGDEMGDEIGAEEVSDEESEKALRRAVTEILYEDMSESRSSDSSDNLQDSDDNSDDVSENLKGNPRFVLSALRNPRQYGGQVTDVQTKPSVPTTIESAADISHDDIDSIRFEIDDEYKTEWFDWGDPESRVHQIVDYYCDGNIGDLLSDTNVNYISDRNSAEITLPDQYNSRTSRFKKEMNDRLRIISGTNKRTPIYSTIGQLASAVIVYLSMLTLTFMLISAIPTVFTLIAAIVLVIIHFWVGFVSDMHMEEHHSVYDHYAAPFTPIYKIAKKAFRKMDRIDQ